MKRKCLISFVSFLLQAFLFCGCIHDYPHPAAGQGGSSGTGQDPGTFPSPNPGEDPTSTGAYVKVTYDLIWDRLIHSVETTPMSRARTERPHRFVIEVSKDGETICHDVIFLTDLDFAAGSLQHRLSKDLGAFNYQIAAWYDHEDNNGDYPFIVNSLRNVELSYFSCNLNDTPQCFYASDSLDLRNYDMTSESVVKKTLQMSLPGARFELVATDVQQFITAQKEALNQGDTFTVQISFLEGAAKIFNLYSSEPFNHGEEIVFNGNLLLPFAEYTELKIAEGFIFCDEEGEAKIRFKTMNSALVTVSQPGAFTFPLKRGYITTILGDFLTNSIDGNFSINNIWEGEIIYEI